MRLFIWWEQQHDYVHDVEILEIMTQSQSPKEAVDELIQIALDAGGYDNVTALVVTLGDWQWYLTSI